MSDEATAGDRLDSLVEELDVAWNDLRAKLAARASQLSDDINTVVDAVSAKVDEVQAAWEARGDESGT